MPEYDQTEVPIEERDNFVAGVQFRYKKDLYNAERDQLYSVQNDLLDGLQEGKISVVDDLLEPETLKTIHQQVFGPIWNWAGRYRSLETNIGVAPAQIRSQLPEEIATIK